MKCPKCKKMAWAKENHVAFIVYLHDLKGHEKYLGMNLPIYEECVVLSSKGKKK